MNSVKYASEYQAGVDSIAHFRLDGENSEVEKKDRGFREAHRWSLENILSKYELFWQSTGVQLDGHDGTHPQIGRC